MQEEALGRPVAPSELRRGDLVFWNGHVAWMLDRVRVLHANAHHMAVAVEPLVDSVARMRAAGGGEPTSYRRLSP
jgi:cell wall-associated NlpC family hydrolase